MRSINPLKWKEHKKGKCVFFLSFFYLHANKCEIDEEYPLTFWVGPTSCIHKNAKVIFVLRKWANKYALSKWFTSYKTLMTMHFWVLQQMAHTLWIIKDFVKNTQQLQRKWRTRIKPESFNILTYFLHRSQLIALSISTPCMEICK